MALDFPSNPTNGQVYDNYYYDSTTGAWNSFASTNNVVPSTLKDATFTTNSVSGVPLTVKGIGSQSSNLQEWKNSVGTTTANITPAGTFNATNLTLANDLPITEGGTGASTAATARTNLGVTPDNIGALPIAGGTMTGTIYGKDGTGGTVANSNETGSFSARGNTSNAAVVSFHRQGVVATNMGLDTDGYFRIGGWSWGANRWQLGSDGSTYQPGSISLDGSFIHNYWRGTLNRAWDNYPSITIANTTDKGPQGEFRIHGIDGANGGDFSIATRCDGGYITGSDSRRKINVEPISDALDRINKISGKTFNVVNSDLDIETDLSSENTGKKFGFIAQDVIGIIPEAVKFYEEANEVNENGYASAYSIDYPSLTALLSEGIKQLSEKVDQLEARVRALEPAAEMPPAENHPL